MAPMKVAKTATKAKRAETAAAGAKVGKFARRMSKAAAEANAAEEAEADAEIEEKAAAGAKALKRPAAAASPAKALKIKSVEESDAGKAGVAKKPAAVGSFARRMSKGSLAKAAAAAADAEEDADDDEDAAVLKKPAAAALKRPAAAEEGAGATKGKAAKAAKVHDERAAVAERKKELGAMSAADLKELVKSKGLDTATKAENVEAMLAFEAREREAKAKAEEERRSVVAEFRARLAAKGAGELKDLCQEKGLKSGGGKTDKVERLLAQALEAGDVERELLAKAREARRTELLAMDNSSLHQMCSKKGVDPLVKEIMVDRLLASEK